MDALFILISILTLCLYNVLIKKFPNKFILFFLVNVFSYLGFLGIYFFRVFVLQHDLSALHELILNYTYQNVPLYVLIAFSFLGYMIVSEKLLNGYDLSLVIPISQFGMLLASAGYIALGDPFKWSLILGLCVSMCWDIYHLSCSDPTILHGNDLGKMEKNSKKTLASDVESKPAFLSYQQR